MSERRYRSGLEGIPGHIAAGKLLNRSNGSHVAAWNELEIFDLDTAHDYMAEQAKAALNRWSEAERIDGICEVATMFALTAVMADRERRREDQEHRTRVAESQAQRESKPEPDQPPPDKEQGNGNDIPF